ncbi:MAG: DUF2250 domain-containing protein [Halodesulfurarchaeum sp.]
MVSQKEIDRLRLEADTIMTRHRYVQEAIDRAQIESGTHWEDGELPLDLETPTGEEITVTVDIDQDAVANAQSRYERAKEQESKRKRQQAVVGKLASMPADPVAYLVCYHLDTVDSNYPRSIAGHLDADREHVEECCADLEQAGVLERLESGTVKQRRAKAKRSSEVRQHHTYYRLSRRGDHILRFLDEREGKLNVLRHLPEAERIVRRLYRGGPDYARMTAEDFSLSFERVRHYYRTLERVGLVTEYEGSIIKGTERKLKPKDETHRKHTYYVTTDVAGELLRERDEEGS